MLYYEQVNGDEDIVIFAKVYTGSFFPWSERSGAIVFVEMASLI